MTALLAPFNLTVFLLLFISEIAAQCGNSGNNLQNYTILSSQESISTSIIDEISGITYNDQTSEFYVVSDDGKLARRKTNGNWQDIDVNDWSGNNCIDNKFGDIEGITYMGAVSGNVYRYAIAEERKRHITFVNLSTNQTSLNYPNNSFLKFSGISFNPPSCGGNDGIESIAYDQNTNTMYFAKERNDQKIYSFTVPNTINGQTISPTTVVDLSTISGLNTYAIHGMDILANGNFMALVAKNGPNGQDPGLYERMVLEFDPCGNLISQVDLEPTINDSAELEGIVSVDNSICVIGEFGVLYHLDAPVIASTFPDLFINQLGTLIKSGNVITSTNVRVTNQGTADATDYSIGAYLSTNLTIDFSDLRIATAKVFTSHQMGQHKFFSFTYDLSSLNLSPGTYYLGYIVDEYDDQNESTETNNTALITTTTISIGGNCPSTMNVDYASIPTGLYETSISIHSQGGVTQSTDVEYSVGDFVELNSGFEVKLNSNFEARIEGCQ